ncbi:hemerythrin domain-containing protein [Undibacterium oligocarboniphilum]|uniref:Hemerythrin domain-containing protein n=1 Tax=Undibacterium oligocarboniphilum TaxID=666702 RepID=A0A850QHH4_9BURK|nr:hemerythrin domain-containing protein [Undibacterium oligocarboniphilum]MBC3868925.1 hemerythrin domain-containing protein [Undibacterium oligocarboniphilum]NVO76905.1 hemerythrin domain-containing protein [Undibacterium oligocarboniphilum]
MSQAVKELVRQHRECDDQLNRVEAALQKDDLASAGRNFRLFHEELEGHFTLEEKKLFPAFEEATGMNSGPTVVMRNEHAEIRSLSDEVNAAIEAGQTAQALAAIDTLNVLIQQHNVKEENVLYPMCGNSIQNLEGKLGMGSACCGACSCG